MTTTEPGLLERYLAPLVGARITAVSVSDDGYPQLTVESDELGTSVIEVASDEEGNRPGFLFGLPRVRWVRNTNPKTTSRRKKAAKKQLPAREYRIRVRLNRDARWRQTADAAEPWKLVDETTGDKMAVVRRINETEHGSRYSWNLVDAFGDPLGPDDPEPDNVHWGFADTMRAAKTSAKTAAIHYAATRAS